MPRRNGRQSHHQQKDKLGDSFSNNSFSSSGSEILQPPNSPVLSLETVCSSSTSSSAYFMPVSTSATLSKPSMSTAAYLRHELREEEDAERYYRLMDKDYPSPRLAVHVGSSSSHHGTRRRRRLNVDEFIWANMRFVCARGSDGPLLPKRTFNHLINWSAIELVHVPVIDDEPACPICLDYPRCPRLTRCGHMFCFTCLLRLFAKECDEFKLEAWKRCPICGEDVTHRQLVAATPWTFNMPKVGEVASFTLVHGKPLLPKVSWLSHQEIVEQVVLPEVAALSLCTDTPADNDAALILAQTLVQDRLIALQKQSTDQIEESRPPPVEDILFWFHQASDGSPAFLDPLSIKIMKTEWQGQYSAFPSLLQDIPVLETEELLVTDDFRRRFKYLSHLPQNLSVLFCQVDLQGVVSEATLDKYRLELEARHKARIHRHAIEERAKQYALNLSTTMLVDESGGDYLSSSSVIDPPNYDLDTEAQFGSIVRSPPRNVSSWRSIAEGHGGVVGGGGFMSSDFPSLDGEAVKIIATPSSSATIGYASIVQQAQPNGGTNSSSETEDFLKSTPSSSSRTTSSTPTQFILSYTKAATGPH